MAAQSTPMGPDPVTSTRLPSVPPDMAWPWVQTASGSEQAASASDTSRLTFTACAASTTMRSRNRPCSCGNRMADPEKRMFRQWVGRPFSQYSQEPQGRDGLIATGSPGATWLTPAPTASTRPEAS